MTDRDRIVIFNIPPRKHRGLRRAVTDGLKKLRSAAKVPRRFDILLYSVTDDEDASFMTDGTVIGPQAMVVDYNQKKFMDTPERERLKDLEGSIIHEAVHALRYGKKIDTVRQRLLDEGISIFIQVLLTGRLPRYLDLEATRDRDIRKWWRWWNKKYFSKPKNDWYWDYQPHREAAYRIGYYAVGKYFDAHQPLTIARLISMKLHTLESFTHTLFRT